MIQSVAISPDFPTVKSDVKLCGYKQGRPQKESNMDCLSLDQIASQLGIPKRNLQRALTIERNLTESMKQLLDDGVISKTVQQRKSGSVLRNWKDYMEFKMVLLHFKVINMRWLRTNRKHQKRHRNNQQHKWVYPLILFRTIKYFLR